jgi:hypothetical protein
LCGGGVVTKDAAQWLRWDAGKRRDGEGLRKFEPHSRFCNNNTAREMRDRGSEVSQPSVFPCQRVSRLLGGERERETHTDIREETREIYTRKRKSHFG